MRPTGAIFDDVAAQVFVFEAEGHRAELVYRRDGDHLVLVHTEVPDALGGRGVGGRLVQAAIERARDEGLTIVAECDFARGWIARHPDAVGSVPDEAPPRT